MERVSYALAPTAAYGKQTGSSDFKLFACKGEVPRLIFDASRALNEAVIKSKGTSLTVLRRIEEAWWLISAFREWRQDESNRPMTGVALGKLERAPLRSTSSASLPTTASNDRRD